jgi:hypothetical protein
MSQLYWTKRVYTLTFESGATTHTEPPIDLNGVATLALLVPSEFSTDTLTLTSTDTHDVGFTLAAATGRNTLDSDQALAIVTMRDLRVTTNNATGGAATITVVVAGG